MSCTIPPECQQILTSDPPPLPNPPEKLIQPLNYDSHGNGFNRTLYEALHEYSQ